MLHPDPRGYRVALVADAVANEGAAGYDVVERLQAATFGMIVPPPSDFAISTIASIIEYTVDDLAEYATQGYRVVVIGSSELPGFGLWDELVVSEIGRRGLAPFDRFDVVGTTAVDLDGFLTAVAPTAVV